MRTCRCGRPLFDGMRSCEACQEDKEIRRRKREADRSDARNPRYKEEIETLKDRQERGYA